jgi:signal transduction histidine kinase
VTREIDELKRVLGELQKAQDVLALAQSLSRTGSFIWRFDSGEVTWSEEMFRIYGVDPSVKPSFEVARTRVHPDDLHIFNSHERKLPGKAGEFAFEHRLLLPDGEVKHLRIIGRAALDDAGNPVEVLGALVDITERIRAADALRASERLARGQLDALTRGLDALVRECEQDKFLEQVLKTLAAELSPRGIRVWESIEGSEGECIGEYDAAKKTFFKNEPSQRLRAAWTPFLPDADESAAAVISLDPPRLRIQKAGEDTPTSWRAIDTADPVMRGVLDHVGGDGIRTALLVPMSIAGRNIGSLTVRFVTDRSFASDEIEIARALAHQVAIALQLSRLSQESQSAAVIAERNRLARDIHDTIAQGLTGVVVQLEAAEDALTLGLNPDASEHIDHAKALARDSLNEARRSVAALRPEVLERRTIREALDALVRSVTKGTGVRVEFVTRGTPRSLPAEYEDNLLRIGQEAITNALRHARPRRLRIALAFTTKSVRLSVRDNGRGFDTARARDGLGLVGIRERVEAIGGRMSLRSTCDRGTRLSVAVDINTATP